MILPLALTDAGWAVIGAVSGGLIGATAGALMDFGLGWFRERKLAKAGARLVASELAAYDSQLEAAEETEQWWGFYGKELRAWSEYKDVLAVMLRKDEFEAV